MNLLKALALISAIFFFIQMGFAAEPPGPLSLKPADYRVSERIADLAFTDISGQSGKLSDYRDADALVIAFNEITCPLCRRFVSVLLQLQKDFAARHVAFLMVNVSPHATLAQMKAGIAELGLTARYLPDLRHEIAQALAGRTSTEVFILDRQRTLVFRGPLSDQFGINSELPAPRREFAREALDELLAGQPISAPAFSAPGCVLGFPTEPPADTNPTYYDRISRIVQHNCQTCHRPGESAPFSLLTYDDVVNQTPMISYVVRSGLMPPWLANPRYGDWANDCSLNGRDKEALLKWIDTGSPQGDPADAPLPVNWPSGWNIGTPDAVVSVPKSFSVPASGVVPYQYVTVKTTLADDVSVNALELRVTHPEVVHHVLVTQADEHGAQTLFAARVPGNTYVKFPRGFGKRLKKGAELTFEIHYTPNGVAVEDRPELGMVFSRAPLEHVIGDSAAVNTTFVIPAGNPNYEVTAQYRFSQAGRILGFMPHMHLRGKAFRYELIYPDRWPDHGPDHDHRSEIVLDIPHYQFNWQLRYELRAPIDVPAGTILKATAWYDNSAANPSNPDPTKEVRWGQQSFEEMMIGYFGWYPVSGSAKRRSATTP